MALALAAEGANVVCSDIRKSALDGGYEDDLPQDTDDVIRAAGGKAEYLDADAGRRDDVQDVVDGTRGRIVNVASIGGLVGPATEPAHCTAKGAVVNLTRRLAVDFSAERINVNAVCPGFLHTAMVRPFIDDPELNQVLHAKTPWPDLGYAEDVATATTFLASGDASWASGSLLTIDGGYTAP